MYNRILLFVSILALLYSCTGNNTDTPAEIKPTPGIPEPANLPYTLMNAYPHDTSAFTQGFEIYNGFILESTGLLERSTLRKVDYKTGNIITQKKLDKDYFGEGLTVLKDTLYQLTWQNNVVLVYDPKSLALIRKMTWSGDGWGISNDGQNLYISDGSDKLYVVRTTDMKLQKVVSVTDNYGPVNNVNELEFINGYIYANRWGSEVIYKIDPSSGLVKGRIDLKDILAKNSKVDLGYLTKPGTVADSGAVLNGIAWDAASGRLLVTGKLWPYVFEIKVDNI